MTYWTVDAEKTKDYWLEAAVISPPGVEPPKEFSAIVKADGCVHLNRHYLDDEKDYIHICDFPEFVRLMNELLHISNHHFLSTGSDPMNIWKTKKDIT